MSEGSSTELPSIGGKRMMGFSDSITTNAGSLFIPRIDNSTAKNMRVALYDATGAKALVVLEDTAHTSGDAGVPVFAVRRDAHTTLVDTTGDYAPLQVDANGFLKAGIFDSASGSSISRNVPSSDAANLGGNAGIQTGGVVYGMVGTSAFDRLRTPNVFKIVSAVSITAATGTTIWDPAAGKKVRLMGYCFSVSAAASLRFYTGSGTALTNEIFRSPLLAAAGVWGDDLGNGILASAADHNLNLDVSANATVTGTVWGVEE